MLNLLLLLAEVTLLFFLSKKVHNILSKLLMRLFNNEKVTVYFLAMLYLPGTFVHEASHFLTSLFLLVPVGKIDLVPEISEDKIRLGSAEIGKTDPFRRFLIGAAPLFMGVSVLLGLIYMATETTIADTLLKKIIVFYLIFTVSNSMFLSKKDLEGAWIILFIILAFVIASQILGININLSLQSGSPLTTFLKDANWYLGVPIVINLVIMLLFGIVK